MRNNDINRIIKKTVSISVEKEEKDFPSLEKCDEMFPCSEMRFLEESSVFQKDKTSAVGLCFFRIIRPAIAVLLIVVMFLYFPVHVTPFSSTELRFEKKKHGFRAYFGEPSNNQTELWSEMVQRMLRSEYTANEFIPTYIPEGVEFVPHLDTEGNVWAEEYDNPFYVRYDYNNEDYSLCVNLDIELSWFCADKTNYFPGRQIIETYTLPDGTKLYMFIEINPLEPMDDCYNLIWGDENITFSLITNGYEFEEVLKIIDGIEFVEWTDIDPQYYDWLD